MGAIQINSVGKIYPNGTRALEDVNIEINDGEFYWLINAWCSKILKANFLSKFNKRKWVTK